MSCTRPLPVYKVPYHDEDGHLKFKIKFLTRPDLSENRAKSLYGKNLLMLPCGHCPSCRMAYRKDWSIRCEMESLFHKDSCFVTLTLNDDHKKPLPVKEDVQYFLHKLRDSYGIKCRYFACGELGSKTHRAHYHIILFGYIPDDLKFFGYSESGKEMYTSKFLDKVWNKGSVRVNYFDIAAACYVAGYVNKDKNQVFLMESTRPGIGYDYMIANFHKLFKYGHYQGKNGQVHKLPRYFKKLCEKNGYDMSHILFDDEVKMAEINTSQKFTHGLMYDGELNALNAAIMKDKLKKLRRGL